MVNSTYPYIGVNGEYYSREFLEKVEMELTAKIPIWQAGIEKPTAVEHFAYYTLRQIKMTSEFKAP